MSELNDLTTATMDALTDSDSPLTSEETAMQAPIATTRKRTYSGEVDDAEDEEYPPSKKSKVTPRKTARVKMSKIISPRQRRGSNKIFPGRPLPRTWAEASEEDKMLITMRDENRSWADIKKEWERSTREIVGTSTLPNRYARLKALLTFVTEADCALMFESLAEVEAAFQKQKWNLVAENVADKGGAQYKGSTLQLQYRKMMMEHGTVPPAGIVAPDFASSEDSE